MGFSSALQGRAAHDALLARQDAELRLLDTMKRCLLQKAKCDKDYATALTAVTQQGMKIDRTDECQGSHIIRAWRNVMDEIEQTAKQFKSNSELLDNICQEKLAQLYQDKRKARKAYQEEHSRIATQFSQLTEEVARKKTDYQKHMEYYKLLRARFEEHYIKSGRGGRKLDDVRDKYQKACRKLHLAHNEYVLLINEAVEVERDFRTCLLPGLLEHQQALQEGFIQTWRNILQDAAQCGDITSDKFREYQKRIESAIQSVNPSEEYKEFTEKHKTTPTAPTIFQFDETLIEDTLGKLQPNTLTVDNLTVDWLRNRLTELETQVKECQEKQSKINTDAGTPTLTRLNGGTNGCLKDDNKNTKDLNALRCQERQMQRLAEIIKSALNEVGCEELPSGCDDLSVEQNFIENNVVPDQSNIPSTSSYILQKGAEVMSLFKAPFRRKSGGGTPMTPEVSPKKERQKSPNRSLGSSVNSLESSSSFSKLEPNLYVDIDNAETNSLILMCENNLNVLMEINNPDFISNGYNNESTVCSNNSKSNTDYIEKSSNSICDSKNNLLVCNDTNSGSVDIMKSSIDIHLDNIDKINKKLDEKMAQEAENSRTNTSSDFLQASKSSSSSNPFDKKDQSFKNKIKQKIKSTSNTINNNSNSSDKNKLIDNNNISMEQENNTIEIPLKTVIDKSPNSLENQIKDLEKLIEVTDKEIKKKSNTKIKRKKKKKSNNSEKLIEDDASAQEEVCGGGSGGGGGITVTDTDKKSKSFSNRSYNAIISSFRDIKNYNKSTNIESVKLTNAKDEQSEEIQDDNNELIDVTNANIDLTSENVLSTGTNDNNSESINTIAQISDEDFDSVSPPIKLDFAIELDEEGNIVSTSKIDQNELPSTQISKSRTTKFKENLKTKLKFNLKFNKSNKKQFCKICSKRFKKTHPSQKLFDFEREFHTENLFEFDSNEFCTCGEDSGDDLTIKNHKYCDPDVVSKMQKLICMMCSSS